MKKFIMIVMCALLVVSMAACGAKEKDPVGVGGTGQVQIANPFVPCENLNDAAELAGFEMTAPASIPNWVTNTEIRVMKKEMIEIVYTGAEHQELRIRKANGNDDISGQYASFDSVEEINVNDLTVTVKGNGDKINVAIWNSGDYAFSVVSEEGFEQEDIENMISTIQ